MNGDTGQPDEDGTTSVIGSRVRELRAALRLTQEQLAAAGGLPDRVRVAKVESGKNQASSYAMRNALAKGFGLCIDDFDAYLDGRLAVADAVARIQAGRSAA
jgi:transcriptional regulator with XRE-family HTH domain